MTLGEMIDQGLTPSEYQVFMLEIEASKKCGAFGHPHLYHCMPYGRDQVSRVKCHHIEFLHHALFQMFPQLRGRLFA
jgi:hypothetical protein